MEKRIEVALLYDFYGPLLTARRAELLRLYLEEDLSLAEIAEELGVSRQGVYDALRHAQAQLEAYEARLNLMARYQAMGREIEKCRKMLDEIKPQAGSEGALTGAKAALDQIEYTRS